MLERVRLERVMHQHVRNNSASTFTSLYSSSCVSQCTVEKTNKSRGQLYPIRQWILSRLNSQRNHWHNNDAGAAIRIRRVVKVPVLLHAACSQFRAASYTIKPFTKSVPQLIISSRGQVHSLMQKQVELHAKGRTTSCRKNINWDFAVMANFHVRNDHEHLLA